MDRTLVTNLDHVHAAADKVVETFNQSQEWSDRAGAFEIVH